MAVIPFLSGSSFGVGLGLQPLEVTSYFLNEVLVAGRSTFVSVFRRNMMKAAGKYGPSSEDLDLFYFCYQATASNPPGVLCALYAIHF